MANRTRSRRDVLRAGGLVVAASTAAMSGCSGLLSSGDGGGFDYATWLPAPSGAGGPYTVQYVRPAKLAAERDHLSELLSSIVEGSEEAYAFTGVAPAELQHLTYFANRAVLGGEFDAEGVASSLESNGFERVGDHADYDIYGREETIGHVVGVGGRVAVLAFGGTIDELRPRVEREIDANRGQVDRYGAANEDMALLFDELPAATVVSASPTPNLAAPAESGGITEKVVAVGTAISVEGADARVTVAAVLRGGDGIDQGAIDEWTNASDRFEAVSVTGTRLDGRLLEVSGELPTTDVSANLV